VTSEGHCHKDKKFSFANKGVRGCRSTPGMPALTFVMQNFQIFYKILGVPGIDKVRNFAYAKPILLEKSQKFEHQINANLSSAAKRMVSPFMSFAPALA